MKHHADPSMLQHSEGLLLLHRYYADMLIATLQDHAYEAISTAGDHEELLPLFTSLRSDPPPMLNDNYEMDSECLTGARLHAAVVPGESAVGLPNWPGESVAQMLRSS